MKSLKSEFAAWVRGAVAEASDCKGLVPALSAGARHPSGAGAPAAPLVENTVISARCAFGRHKYSCPSTRSRLNYLYCLLTFPLLGVTCCVWRRGFDGKRTGDSYSDPGSSGNPSFLAGPKMNLLFNDSRHLEMKTGELMLCFNTVK